MITPSPKSLNIEYLDEDQELDNDDNIDSSFPYPSMYSPSPSPRNSGIIEKKCM